MIEQLLDELYMTKYELTEEIAYKEDNLGTKPSRLRFK